MPFSHRVPGLGRVKYHPTLFHPLWPPLTAVGAFILISAKKKSVSLIDWNPKIHENLTLCIACFQDEYISCTSPKFCFRGAPAWCISPIAWGPLRLLSSLGQQAGPGQAGTSIIRASYGASSGLHMVAHIALDMAIYMGRYMANDLQLLWAPDSLGQNFCYRILS